MREELTKKLFERFLTMFKPEKSPQETLMCFGFECDDGWFQIIWDTCEKLENLDEEKIKSTSIDERAKLELEGLNSRLEIVQVKEKFGGLRIYTSVGTEEQYKVIQEAERKSEETCENCGKEGTQTRGGWVKTLCPECKYDK